MSGSYEDIICLPHHVSSSRSRMSMIDRAAQFSPFAALTGYEAAIEETGRLTDSFMDPELEILNEKIRRITEHLDAQPEITVTYFVPDERKSGGAYTHVTGKVKKIDQYEQVIVMADGTKLPFSRIYDISGGLFLNE